MLANGLMLVTLLLLACLPQSSTVARTAPRGITLRVQRKELYAAQPARSEQSHRRVQHGQIGTSGAVSGGVMAGMYLAPVAIGTPPRIFQLQLDTGSATLAVPSASCGACARGFATADGETGLVSLHDLTQLYSAEKSSTGEWIGCHSDECGVGGCDRSRGAAAGQCGSPRSLGACVLRQGCQDEASWHSTQDGFSFVTCDYISNLDPGCTNYRDYGQKTHCLETCDRCQDCCTSSGGCWFGVHYLDGSGLQGRLARDVVRIGGDWMSTVTSFGAFESFDVQRGATSAYWKAAPADGIWGLGSSARNCKPTCQPSVLDAFCATNGLDAIFALCAGSASLGGSNSFDIGHIDQHKALGQSIHYISLVDAADFIIDGPSTVRVGATAADIYAADWGSILVDSGASNCVFSDAVFSKLIRAATTAAPAYVELWSSPNRCMIVSSCQFDLETLPVISLDFLDEHHELFTIDFSPREYTIWRSGDSLCLNIKPMSAIGSPTSGTLRYGSILGDNFFSQRYIVFDTRPDYNRVGLSQVENCHAGRSMGCTDPLATNYASSADEDDGSCEYSTEDCAVLLISSDADCTQHVTGAYRISTETPMIDGRVHYTTGTRHLYWSESHSTWYIDPDTEPCTYWALSRTQSAHPATGSWFVYCEAAEQFSELHLNVAPCSHAVGCTDPAATNFQEDAHLDDGFCGYDDHCTLTGSGGCPRAQFNGMFQRDADRNGRPHYIRRSPAVLHIYHYTSNAGWSRWLLDSDLLPDAYLGYVDSASQFPPRQGWWLYCVAGSGRFDDSPNAVFSYCDSPSSPPPPPPPPLPPPPSPSQTSSGCASLSLSGGCRLGAIQGVYTLVPNAVQSGQAVYRKGSLSRWVYYDSANRRWLVDQDQDSSAAFALGAVEDAVPAIPPVTGWTQYCGTAAGYEDSSLNVLCQ
jgi:hypothetical protein